MTILVNSDSTIQNDERLTDYVKEMVKTKFKHFEKHITRVKVHMSDVNADKGGARDKEVSVETRIEHMKPLAITHKDNNLENALHHALDKSVRNLKQWKEKHLDSIHKR